MGEAVVALGPGTFPRGIHPFEGKEPGGRAAFGEGEEAGTGGGVGALGEGREGAGGGGRSEAVLELAGVGGGLGEGGGEIAVVGAWVGVVVHSDTSRSQGSASVMASSAGEPGKAVPRSGWARG